MNKYEVLFIIGVLVATALGQDLGGESTITFSKQGDRNLYGNNVTSRATDLPTGGHKAWVDLESPLPSGTLKQFFIYVHSRTVLTPPNDRIRLQIWRPVDLTIYQFQLVFEQKVDVNLGTGRLYKFPVDATFQVAANDLIGWTNEGEVGPISFNYYESRRTIFCRFAPGVFPQLSQTYKFDDVYLPSVFSIAALVEPTKTGAPEDQRSDDNNKPPSRAMNCDPLNPSHQKNREQ